MAEAEILPCALLHLDGVLQSVIELPLCVIAWLQHAWPLTVSLGFVTNEFLLATVDCVLRALYYLTDFFRTVASYMPTGVVHNQQLILAKDFVAGFAIQIMDLLVGVFQSAEPMACWLFEEGFFALSNVVELVPTPFEVSISRS